MILYFIIVGPAILFSIWATIKVKSTFARYSKVGSISGLTGAQAARTILDRNGLIDVEIQESQGWLSDHYDPSKKVLRLSPEVYRSPSLASIGIAAHEAGHAVQHAEGYAPLSLRQTLIPIGTIGSNFAMIFILAGIFFGAFLTQLGILLFAAAVVVTLINLPVEFNASNRARAMITQYGLVTDEEATSAGKVLNAAAMTYVAAALTALLQLLYLLRR